MRLLVTGAAGFLGRHLCRALAAAHPGADIVGLELLEPAVPVEGVRQLIAADVSVPGALDRPEFDGLDAVLHLAALLPPAAGSDLLRVNLRGTVEVLARAARDGRRVRFVLVSSSAVYGFPAKAGPIGEDTPLAPVNAYGESFVAREMAARLLARDLPLDVTVVRPFNLAGPGQRATMMIPSFAERLARVEAGLQPPEMQVGRLDTARDYVDVRDVADALVRLVTAERPEPVLNLSSGTARSGQAVLDALLDMACVRPAIRQAIDGARSTDPLVLVGDAGRAHRTLGWTARIPFKTTLRDTLEDWRGRVRAGQTADRPRGGGPSARD